jgi:hypothetical protein
MVAGPAPRAAPRRRVAGILSQLAFFISSHAKELRPFFVGHEGRRTVEVNMRPHSLADVNVDQFVERDASRHTRGLGANTQLRCALQDARRLPRPQRIHNLSRLRPGEHDCGFRDGRLARCTSLLDARCPCRWHTRVRRPGHPVWLAHGLLLLTGRWHTHPRLHR